MLAGRRALAGSQGLVIICAGLILYLVAAEGMRPRLAGALAVLSREERDVLLLVAPT